MALRPAGNGAARPWAEWLARIPVRGRAGVGLALAAVVALHVALTLHFVPLELVFGADPLVALDYDVHYQQTLRAVDAYRTSGRVWCYDPHLLAGQPSGAIFDANNKLLEVVAIALDGLAVPTHRAFNLSVLCLHLLVPFVFFAAARLFRLPAPAAVLAALLGSMVWFFDSFAHWCFFVGMISWGSASYLWVLPLAAFYRWTITRRPWLLALAFVLLAVLHTLHGYVFLPLVVPMLVLYLRARRQLERRQHVAVWGVAAGVLLFNAWWLIPAARLWYYVIDSAFYLGATPAYFLYDYLGLLKEMDTQGVIGVRTGFRFLVLAAAVLGLWAWRRARDDRFLPLAAGLGTLLLVAYVGGWVHPLRQIQPYRLALPAVFLAIIPAAAWLAQAVRSLVAARPPAPALGLVALLVVVALPKLTRDVLYFFPDWVPRVTRVPTPPPPNLNQAAELGTIPWQKAFQYRMTPIKKSARDLAAFVEEHDDGQGRWLVEWWMLGERLAWATDAQILGGFRELNLMHSDANLFRRFPTTGAPDDPAELQKYFDQYNVKWVVLTNSMPLLERRLDLFAPVALFEVHRVYRVRKPGSWVVGGGPGTVDATVDRLDVRGSAGGELVLKYHYLKTLECRPSCELYRAPVPGNRVGFIGVRGAPPDFQIVNP